MLNMLFLQILNMSFTASVIIPFVLIARLLLKKTPKIFSYALWSVVLFRLVCPFSFESFISLLPVNANPISSDIMYAKTPQVSTGIPIINDSINAVLPAATPDASINPMQVWIAIGSFLWLIGITALIIYSVISLIMLKNRLKNAIHEKENIYTSNNLTSPFVMGIFHPKIYLPAKLSDDERQYIVLHEQTHIKRFDHTIKLLSFFVLCLHWFNPLVWVTFFISGRDMEMSCDETVIKKLGTVVKKDYSSSLLTLATGRKIVGGTPLAFGEGDTRGRIKNVLNYKKPSFWVIIVAVVAVVILGIGLIANPKEPPSNVNTIYTAKLTDKRKSELANIYQLTAMDNTFETKFHVSDTIKSYVYYVELYQSGEFLGTFMEQCSNFDTKDGSIVTAFSMNRGETDRWENMRWMTSFADGGYDTHLAIPFPEGFVPQGFSTSTLASEGDAEEMSKIVPEQPIIIAIIGMNSAVNSEIRSYSSYYLMNHPEAIAQYECVYIVKCMFSEKDATELEKMLPIGGNVTTDDFSAVTMTENLNGENQAPIELTDHVKINKLSSLMLMGKATNKQSVQDTPNKESYIHIAFVSTNAPLDYFVYEEAETYYIEQPYKGIWEIRIDTLEQIMSIMTEKQRVDVAETPADVEVFLSEISQSFQIKEGVARFIVPAKMPEGYAPSQLSVHVSGSMPMGDDGSNMSLHAYEKEDESRNWQIGNEYIEKMFDSNVPDGTEIYASFYLIEKGSTVSKYYTTVSKLFPLREDTFIPSVVIEASGSVQEVTFSDRFNDKLTLICSLPDGWSLKIPTTDNAQLAGENVHIYVDNIQVGSLSYEHFKLYRDEAGNIPYMSVYGGIMLGSMASWDKEYTEIYKDEIINVATCKPWHNISFPGVSNAGAATVYSKGILAYHTGASKYVAIELDDDSVSDAQWQTIAKSVKLSTP